MSGRLETKVTPSAATMRRVLGKAITPAEAAAELPDGLDVRLSMANNATEAKAALALSVEAFTAQHGRVLGAVRSVDEVVVNPRLPRLDKRARQRESAILVPAAALVKVRVGDPCETEQEDLDPPVAHAPPILLGQSSFSRDGPGWPLTALTSCGAKAALLFFV